MKKLFLSTILILLSAYSSAQIGFNLSTERLSDYKLGLICDNELKWLRNEIYARHGYVFSNKEIQSRFENANWYKPAENNNLLKINKIEQDNIIILKNEENRRNARVKAIKDLFMQMKVNKKHPIYKQVKDMYEGEGIYTEILPKIDIDAMTFCGAKGKYSVSIDDGNESTTYFLDVNGDVIRLGISGGGSDIIESIADERSKIGEDVFWGEGLTFWQFEIDNNNSIRFIKIDGAG